MEKGQKHADKMKLFKGRSVKIAHDREFIDYLEKLQKSIDGKIENDLLQDINFATKKVVVNLLVYIKVKKD